MQFFGGEVSEVLSQTNCGEEKVELTEGLGNVSTIEQYTNN